MQSQKKPYEQPKLSRLGTIRDLTGGGLGSNREPGGSSAPKTKQTGTTA
jgi:hypothetical protein